MTDELCHRCDRRVATEVDYDACVDGCACERCLPLCWSDYGVDCQALDWRARAMKAESELAAARDGTALGDAMADLRAAIDERDRLAARLDALRRLEQAARAWRRYAQDPPRPCASTDDLRAAVDALPKEAP